MTVRFATQEEDAGLGERRRQSAAGLRGAEQPLTPVMVSHVVDALFDRYASECTACMHSCNNPEHGERPLLDIQACNGLPAYTIALLCQLVSASQLHATIQKNQCFLCRQRWHLGFPTDAAY